MDSFKVRYFIIWANKSRKTLSFGKQKILSDQGNGQVHNCVVSIPKIMKLIFELLQDTSYSPDLVARGFFISKVGK